MAKQIVLLDITENQPGIVNLRCVFWFSVTAGYPNATFVSAYPDIGTTDPDVLNSLRAGTMIEEEHVFQFPTSSLTTAWSTVELIIAAFYTSRKNYRSGIVSALPDPGAKYKVFNDSSTGWSA